MQRLAVLLIATACLVTLTSTPAQAELISGIIGLTALITSFGVGAATAGAIGGAIVGIGISVGVSLLASVLKGAPDADGTSPTRSGATLSVQYGSDIPRSARMGPGATGGHHVYVNCYGGQNDFMQCVFVIGDGKHGKLTGLRYNGKQLVLPGYEVIGSDAYWVVQEYVTETGDLGAPSPHVVVRYYDGRYDQNADTELVANSNPPGRWTAEHRGRGVAYLSITQAYSEELQLTGIPQLLIETEGLVLYDPRKDSTNGGSGAHRWGQVDTYEPSSNPAVQEYNVRRGVLVNGQRILGMNISPVNLLLPMYVAAANINDEAIPLAAGGTEPRYRASVELSDARSNADVLGAIRAATAGFSLERGGQFGPIPGVPQIPDSSLAFTDDDLIVGERATFTKYRSRSDLVTAVHGKFSDPAQGWQSTSFPAREDPADDAAIGEKLAKDLDLSQVFSSSQAQRIAESERRRTLQQGQGSVTLPAKWIGVQPGDWLTYNSARHGTMTVLVISTALDTVRHVVTLGYERTSNSVYSWTTAGELFPPDVGAGGVPGTIILQAAGMTATGVNLPGDGGLVTPGIAFAWTPILDPSVDQIDFEIRKVSDAAVLPFTADFPSSGSAVCSHGIQAATNYEYRHKLYTTPLRDTPWSAWATVTSGTDHIVPHALTSIPGDVALASFEAGLRDYVANQLSASMEELDRIAQLIASEATEQDAHNFLHKQDTDRVTTRIVEQVSAQFGTTWRGAWNAETPYNANDQVSFGPDYYYTPVDVAAGVLPTDDPWRRLLSAAKISDEWISFAGEDGAAAQTSQSIETRFGASTLEQSVAEVHSEWSAYAGPDGASAATHDEIIAAINGSSVTIAGDATAVATVEGKLLGSFSMTIDAGGRVSGYKAYNDGTTSVFNLLTDTFTISRPGTSPQAVFSLGTSQTGATKLVLAGDLIASGTITSNAIVAGSITAIKMAVGAIAASNIIVGDIIVTGHLTADAATYMVNLALGNKALTPGDNKLQSGAISLLTGRFSVICSFGLSGSFSESPIVYLLANGTRVRTWRVPFAMQKESTPPEYVKSGGNTSTHTQAASFLWGAGSFTFGLEVESSLIGVGNSLLDVNILVLESRR